MAFRTNKVPAIEERTVSGSSVSFNSAFALPLKACKVSFEGTQEGSGTTSPTNKRPLTYKSNVSVTDNGSTNIISLGGRRFYKFDLDVLNGILEPTMEIVTIDENSDIRMGGQFYIKSDATDFYVIFEQIYPSSSMASHGASFALCDTFSYSNAQIWGVDGYPNKYGVNYQQIHCNIANDLLGITDYTQETTTTALAKIKAWLTDNPITCAIPIEPITIQLSANELSSIIGNNTFSTDTGTLEITFADLQEKSASGSVATFNTALAMPLPSCNIAVNAWQEGSGDPSPDNIRPIHGFSEVNVTRAGKNLCNSVSENSIYYIDAYANYTISDNAVITTGNTLIGFIIPVLPNTTYTLSFVRESDVNSEIRARQYSKIPSDWLDGYISQTSGTDRITVTTGATTKVLLMSVYATSANRFSNWQCEAGSTATPYEPYVTPTIYTIQLGQEVYGAEVDAINGVAHVTHAYYKTTGNESISAYDYNNQHGVHFGAVLPKNQNRPSYISNMSKYTPAGMLSSGAVWCGVNNGNILYWIGILDILNMTLEEFKLWIVDHPLEVAYPMNSADQFDIQLTPTQIETLIGNNTIFADTGDIDLTYKDLDIAKRGNFREVFKLPS